MVGLYFKYDHDTVIRDQWILLARNHPEITLYERGKPDDLGNESFNTVGVNSVDELPDVPLILLTPQNSKYLPGDVNIVDFTHPTDCIYMFGNDREATYPEEFGSREYTKVYISTMVDYWSPQTATIVLWERNRV